MAIRLNAKSPNGFRHGGITLGKGWQSFDSLTKQQRETVAKFHPRYLRIHPEDLSNLAELGLAYKDAESPLELVQAKSTPPAPPLPTPPSPASNPVAPSDKKKER